MVARPGWQLDPRLGELGRFAGAIALAALVFGPILLAFGKNPVRAYETILVGALG